MSTPWTVAHQPPCLRDKESACQAGDAGSTPVAGRFLKKEMATHSTILAWEIPMDPGRMQISYCFWPSSMEEYVLEN